MTGLRPRFLWPALALLATACATPTPEAPEVRTWGTMREVLRDGQVEGRIAPLAVTGPHTIGVGALAGLAGEVTIVDGRVLLALADPAGEDLPPRELHLRAASGDDQAALLVIAEVRRWVEHPLPACADYGALDAAIADRLRAEGYTPGTPVAIRVRGTAARMDAHVIAGACPIAHPDGPAPFRYTVREEAVELVGFHAEGAAGRLTHHTHTSHLHAIDSSGRSGHLDEIALRDAVLLVPAGGADAD